MNHFCGQDLHQTTLTHEQPGGRAQGVDELGEGKNTPSATTYGATKPSLAGDGAPLFAPPFEFDDMSREPDIFLA